MCYLKYMIKTIMKHMDSNHFEKTLQIQTDGLL